jgi:hypothetical protein
MTAHPYLRAYMAGIVVPTMFLLVIFAFFWVMRFVYNVPIPIEHVLVFPMALVPNLWGVWNILYLRMHTGRRLPIGLHGAMLVFVLSPIGYLLVRAQQYLIVPSPLILAIFGGIMVIYYLVWKYAVAFLNDLLGISS